MVSDTMLFVNVSDANVVYRTFEHSYMMLTTYTYTLLCFMVLTRAQACVKSGSKRDTTYHQYYYYLSY
jgi:hypothetical protein